MDLVDPGLYVIADSKYVIRHMWTKIFSHILRLNYMILPDQNCCLDNLAEDLKKVLTDDAVLTSAYLMVGRMSCCCTSPMKTFN